MKRFVLAALLASFAFAPIAAQAAPPQVTSFEAVDAVTITESFDSTDADFEIEGLLEGGTQVVTRSLQFGGSNKNIAQRCYQMALLAQAKPGRYLFQIIGSSSSSLDQCRLRRR